MCGIDNTLLGCVTKKCCTDRNVKCFSCRKGIKAALICRQRPKLEGCIESYKKVVCKFHADKYPDECIAEYKDVVCKNAKFKSLDGCKSFVDDGVKVEEDGCDDVTCTPVGKKRSAKWCSLKCFTDSEILKEVCDKTNEKRVCECTTCEKVCCKEDNPSCNACQLGVTSEQYCSDNPTAVGCPSGKKQCCDAPKAHCYACQEEITLTEYCEKNPSVAGCSRPCCKAKKVKC